MDSVIDFPLEMGQILVSGKESTLDKIKVGMEVAVFAGTDPTLAASVKASDESRTNQT